MLVLCVVIYIGVCTCCHTKVVARKVGSIQWLRDSGPDVYLNFYQRARNMSASEVEALCKRQVSFVQQKDPSECY